VQEALPLDGRWRAARRTRVRAIPSALRTPDHRGGPQPRRVAIEREGVDMDVRAEARRLASVATFFVWVGWIAVVYAVVAGVLWWIDLASRDGFSFLEALGISLNAVGGPIFLALIVAGLGHFVRLFAMDVAGRA
jgi:hypothetical protein